MPTAHVNNCNLTYERRGSGPCVIFIHGESHGIEMFADQLPHFSKRYDCIAYYRRGHGKSESALYGYSLWNQTQDLACLLDHLNIQQAVIIAVAMSTTIASTYTLLHPERVRALVLASWYELDGYPELEKRRKKHPISFAELHLMMGRILVSEGRAALVEFLEREHERYFPIFPRDKAVRLEVAKMFASHPPEHYVQSAEFYTSIPNITSQMGAVTCPVLGISGDDDPSPDRPELLARLPNFRQTWIGGARRFTMMEQPEAFNREVDKFLASLDVRDSPSARGGMTSC